MQELPLREKIHISLKVLASVRVHDSYEDIVKLIEKHRQEVLDKNHLNIPNAVLRTPEILLLIKYICHHKLQLGENVPNYFSLNIKKPIKSEITVAIREELVKQKNITRSLEVTQSKVSQYPANGHEIPDVDDVTEIESLEGRQQKIILSAISELNFSARLTQMLQGLGITYFGQLLCLDCNNMASFSNVGKKLYGSYLIFCFAQSLKNSSRWLASRKEIETKRSTLPR